MRERAERIFFWWKLEVSVLFSPWEIPHPYTAPYLCGVDAALIL